MARLAGVRTRLVHSPVGVIGLRGPAASPWAEPALEAGASLLAGNGVLLSAGALGQRLRGVFLRAGVPGELIALVPPDALEACRRVVDLKPPSRGGILLVLHGAPRAKVVEAAMWAAFAGSGRHPSAAGRLITVAGAVPGLLEALTAGAAALRVGDPRDPETDVGPLARAEDAQGLVGEPFAVPGLDGVFWTPTVVGGVSPDDPLFLSPPPAPILAVVEAPDTETAIALAAAEGRDGPVSVWARDPAQGERVARRLRRRSHGSAATASRRPPCPYASRATSWPGSWSRAPRGRAARRGCPRTPAWCRRSPRSPSTGTGASRAAGPRCARSCAPHGESGERRRPSAPASPCHTHPSRGPRVPLRRSIRPACGGSQRQDVEAGPVPRSSNV